MDRIEQMERELAYIKKRLESLEERLELEKQRQQPQTGRAPNMAGRRWYGTAGTAPGQEMRQGGQGMQQVGQEVQQPVQNSYQPNPADRLNGLSMGPQYGPVPQQTYPRGRQMAESVLGKYALPVAAAVLIVFGIGVLAVMVWDYVADYGKALVVALMGMACFGVGCGLGRSERMRLFKHSMTAIALAILYADIIAMNFAWLLIPETAALLLVLLWCALAAAASLRYGEKLFYYVMEAGICVTAFLAAGLITDDGYGLFLFVLTFAVWGLSILCFRRQYRCGNNAFGLSAGFIFLAQSVAVSDLRFLQETGRSAGNVCLWMELLFFAALLIFAGFYEKILFEPEHEMQNRRALAVGCCLAFFLPFCAYAADLALWGMERAGHLLVLAFGFLMLRNRKHRKWLSGFVYFHMLFCAYMAADWWDAGKNGFLLLTAVYFLLDLFLDDLAFRIPFLATELLTSVLWLFFEIPFIHYGEREVLAYGLPLLLSGICFVIFTSLKERRISFKISVSCFVANLYFLGVYMGGYSSGAAEELWRAGAMVLAYLCLGAALAWLKEGAGDEGVFRFVWAAVVEIVLLGEYGRRLGAFHVTVMGVLLLVHIVLCAWLTDLQKEGSAGRDVWFSILVSLNLLRLTERTPLWNMAILVSLFMMAIAAALILGGFKLRRKGFRLYGLIFIILSVAKMILFDISGSDSAIRVAALIAGGIICLAISYVYNRMEKKLDESENNP